MAIHVMLMITIPKILVFDWSRRERMRGGRTIFCRCYLAYVIIFSCPLFLRILFRMLCVCVCVCSFHVFFFFFSSSSHFTIHSDSFKSMLLERDRFRWRKGVLMLISCVRLTFEIGKRKRERANVFIALTFQTIWPISFVHYEQCFAKLWFDERPIEMCISYCKLLGTHMFHWLALFCMCVIHCRFTKIQFGNGHGGM